MAFLRDPFDFEIEQARKFAVAVEEARATLPANLNFQTVAPFGPVIISAMTSCFYAAGLRDKALEGAAITAPNDGAHTCLGYTSALRLAAEARDHAFIEVAEKTAIAQELEILRQTEAKNQAAAADKGEPNANAQETPDQVEERLHQKAVQNVHSTFWESQVVGLLKRALTQDKGPKREGEFAFWAARIGPRYDYEKRLDTRWLAQEDWLSLCDTAAQHQETEKLDFLFSLSAQVRKSKTLGAEAVRCLQTAWNNHWVEGVRLSVPRCSSDSGIRSALLRSAQTSGESAEISHSLIHTLHAAASPSDEELRGWLKVSVQESLSASVPNKTPRGEAFFQRAQVLLAMGADPSLEGVIPHDYSHGKSCSSVLLTIFAPYFFKDSPTKCGAGFDEWADRMLHSVLRAPTVSALREKINVPTAWDISGVRKISWLSAALLAERFPAAEWLVEHGADWRDSKNVFDTRHKKAVSKTSPAFAFFEAMQLRETLQKKRRGFKTNPSVPIVVIEADESSLRTQPEPRLRTRRL